MFALLKTIPMWVKLLGGGAIGYAIFKEAKKPQFSSVPHQALPQEDPNALPPFPPDPGYNDDPGYDEGGGSSGGGSSGGGGGGGASPYPPPATTLDPLTGLPPIYPPGTIVPIVATTVPVVGTKTPITVTPGIIDKLVDTVKDVGKLIVKPPPPSPTPPITTTPLAPKIPVQTTPRVDIVQIKPDGGMRTVPTAMVTTNLTGKIVGVSEVKPGGAIVPLPVVSIRPSTAAVVTAPKPALTGMTNIFNQPTTTPKSGVVSAPAPTTTGMKRI